MISGDAQEYKLGKEILDKNEIRDKILIALKKVDFEEALNSAVPNHNIIDKSTSIALTSLLAEQAVDYIMKAIEVSKDRGMDKVGPAALIIAADKIKNPKE